MAAQIEFFSRNFGRAESLYSEVMKADHAGGVRYYGSVYGSVRFLSAIGFIHAATGLADGKALLNNALKLDEKELRAAPDNPSLLYSLAADYAALGEGASSLKTLESAIQAGWIDFRSMTLDPRFDAVRTTPRFQQAIAHLQQATRDMAETTGKSPIGSF
jgi:tetratricopeptide (TPR) repeat protein